MIDLFLLIKYTSEVGVLHGCIDLCTHTSQHPGFTVSFSHAQWHSGSLGGHLVVTFSVRGITNWVFFNVSDGLSQE